jgi:hypothetical protein
VKNKVASKKSGYRTSDTITASPAPSITKGSPKQQKKTAIFVMWWPSDGFITHNLSMIKK